MHVIVAERLHDAAFVDRHTVGFDELSAHVAKHDPRWAARVCGVEADRIVALARRYATTRPAMIVLAAARCTRANWAGKARAPSLAFRH